MAGGGGEGETEAAGAEAGEGSAAGAALDSEGFMVAPPVNCAKVGRLR